MGASGFQQNDSQKSWTIRDDATYRMGQHTLKAAVKLFSSSCRGSRLPNERHLLCRQSLCSPAGNLSGELRY